MDKKVLFNETLTSLVEFAAANGNEISMEDVKLYFKDFIEDESQYQFLYDYLTINKIKVTGFVPSKTNAFGIYNTVDNNQKDDSDKAEISCPSVAAESEEELAFIDMYMKELESIPPISEKEITSLISALLSGDLSVVDRLVECHLALVAELAQHYRGRGVTFGDLIQEGNVGLMVAISEFNDQSGDFKEFISKKITDALKETINLQINSDRVGQHLADKLNRLDEVTKNLSEKLGRVPEIAELAEAMNTSEDEISLLLKTSLDTLSVNEDTQITDPSSDTAASFDIPKEDPLQWRVNRKDN